MINFLLKNPEIIQGVATASNEKGQTIKRGNIRIWTKFFDAISRINDFRKDFQIISNLASGSLPSEHIQFFQMFIDQKLDTLMSPVELLKDEKKSIEHLKEVIGTGNNRRQDLSSIFAKRLLNYALTHSDEYTPEKIGVYGKLLKSGYLSQDLVTLSMKKLVLNKKFEGYIRDKELTNLMIS